MLALRLPLCFAGLTVAAALRRSEALRTRGAEVAAVVGLVFLHAFAAVVTGAFVTSISQRKQHMVVTDVVPAGPRRQPLLATAFPGQLPPLRHQRDQPLVLHQGPRRPGEGARTAALRRGPLLPGDQHRRGKPTPRRPSRRTSRSRSWRRGQIKLRLFHAHQPAEARARHACHARPSAEPAARADPPEPLPDDEDEEQERLENQERAKEHERGGASPSPV